MAKVLIVFLAAVALQACVGNEHHSGLVRPAIFSRLEALATRVKTSADNFNEQLRERVQNATHNSSEFVAAQVHATSENFQNVLDKFQAEIDSRRGRHQEALQQAADNIKTALANVRDLASPQLVRNTDEVAQSIQDNVKSVADDIDNFITRILPDIRNARDSIGNFTSNVVDNFVSDIENFNQQFTHPVQQNV